jgi:transposase
VSGTVTWAALDVHARSVEAAAVSAVSGELVRRRFGGAVGPVVGWLSALPAPVHACYEAGPTGYGLARACVEAGVRCDVIAPSKTPRAAGERIKTDRRDAERLVRLLMAGSLQAVAVPSVEMEAVRDLVRSRARLRDDLARARQRVSKMLLRYGRVYPKKTCWTKQHRVWLGEQQWQHPASELAYLDYLAAVDGLVARRAAIDERLSRIAQDPSLWPTVARLRCFRGVDTLTALGLVVEVGDWSRFRRPAQLSSWLGLVPSLSQSGESLSRGGITKTGSQHARRLLVESAWHYTRVPRIGGTLAQRQADQPAHVLQIAWRAQTRLYRLHRRLRERGKPPGVVTVAVARELSGFLWAAAQVT